MQHRDAVPCSGLAVEVARELVDILGWWFDKNRETLAQAAELVPLTEAGVEAIDLDYTLDGRITSKISC